MKAIGEAAAQVPTAIGEQCRVRKEAARPRPREKSTTETMARVSLIPSPALAYSAANAKGARVAAAYTKVTGIARNSAHARLPGSHVSSGCSSLKACVAQSGFQVDRTRYPIG